MAEYGDMFPDNPQNLEELVDSLVRRMTAAERLLDSLSDEQREELANLMAQAMEDAGLAAEMAALGDALRARRPELGAAAARACGCPARSRSASATRPARVADLADLADLESRARPGLRRAPASTTSTRRRCAARSAGRRSTTSRRCAGSSASCSGRAT